MARPQPVPKISFEEFLKLEARSEVRHELIAGEIHAMASGSKNHNLIVGNTYIALRARHDALGCRVYAENVLLRLNPGDDTFGYYPDVMLVCDPDDAPGESCVEKPCALIEVLSDTTQHVDRGEKFRDYKTLEPLKIYLLVSQQAVHVTMHQRANSWQPEVRTRLDDVITFDCVPGTSTALTLAEIYRGLDFGI